MDLISVELPYGHGARRVKVPVTNLQATLTPMECQPSVDEATLLRDALANPIGTPRLRDMARRGQRVVIVTSDLTRPCPSERLLPLILEELSLAGIPDTDVTVVVALGLHRPMTQTETETAVGMGVYRRVQVVNHCPADCTRLGVTSTGTPVELFRPLTEANLLVCLGNLELHYFAGYSGGAKAVLPGCASRATIKANHALMVHSAAVAARTEDNPVRADLEEGASFLGVDFILNVMVTGAHRRVVSAVAGDVIAAHRRGCEQVAEHSVVKMNGRGDIVLVSAGGYPQDLNLYQAQKALDNGARAVRRGGIIILVAECSEAFGNETFEAWMTEAWSPEEVLKRLSQNFVLGGHKAAAFAKVLNRARVYLVSKMQAEAVGRSGLVPFKEPDRALEAALREVGPQAQVVVMPQGGSTLPVVQ